MDKALHAWLKVAAQSGDPILACTAAAEAVAQIPGRIRFNYIQDCTWGLSTKWLRVDRQHVGHGNNYRCC